MAKQILPTNYQDDILHSSAGGKRKYRMLYNDDGTVSFDDVTPYDQEGSDYGALDINRTNEAVNESFDKNKIIRDMTAINAVTEEGYVPDALALKEVKDRLGCKLLYGTNSTNLNINLRTSFINLNFADNPIPANGYVDVEIDISEYKFKSLIYAIPQNSNVALRVIYKYSGSTAQKVVFTVVNNGTSAYNGGIYPYILYIGTV